MKPFVALATVAFLAGCAAYDGRTLSPGSSTMADVEALMGEPAERLERGNGEKVLYYLRSRDTYAVVLGADGGLRSIEPRLSKANIAKIVSGSTSAKEVRELFGPPRDIARMDRLARDVWEYEFQHYDEMRVLWVQFSYDGVVKEMLDMLDWKRYPPGLDASTN